MLDETVKTRRSWRGSPRSCVLAGAFLRFVGIILTVSKLFRYAPTGEYVCATGARGARTLLYVEMEVIMGVLHRFYGAHLGPTLLATTEKSKKNLKNIIDI